MAGNAFSSLGIPLVVTLGGLISLWILRWPRLTVGFLCLSLVSGQVLRVALPGQGGGLLLSDLAVVVVLLRAVWQLRYSISPNTRSLAIGWLGMTLLFVGWSAWTLAINWSVLSASELLIAASYWVRLISLLLLFPALLCLTDHPVVFQSLSKYFLLTIASLVGLGLVQLFALPRLQVLGLGWDPHEHRLVSTWLDPNFFGGFIGLVLPWLVATWSSRFATKHRWLVGALLILTIIALLFTRSRSSLLAMSVSWLALSLIYLSQLPARWRRPMTWLTGGTLLLLVGLVGVGLLGQRAIGLLTYDPTVDVRLAALQQIWPLAQAHTWLGVGYNAYQFAAQQAGLIGDFTIHSRAGADNSFLTLWVTTGLPGVILFIVPWAYLASHFLRQWWRRPNFLYLAWFLSWLTWFIQAQFVNSLLYSHLFITMVIISVLIIQRDRPSELTYKAE